MFEFPIYGYTISMKCADYKCWQVNNGFSIGLVLSGSKAISWTCVDQGPWCHIVSLGLNELKTYGADFETCRVDDNSLWPIGARMHRLSQSCTV